MTTPRNNSQHQPSPNNITQQTCDCGRVWLGRSNRCACGQLAKSDGEDMLRKTFDTPDLRK